MKKITLGTSSQLNPSASPTAAVVGADRSAVTLRPPTVSPGSSAAVDVSLPEQVDSIYLDREYLDTLALFRQEPIDLPADSRLVLDGVVNIADQVDLVDHLMAPGGLRREPPLLHPLTDKIAHELQSITTAMYAMLNIRKSEHGAFRLLGANDAIELDSETKRPTGKISDLVVYSATDGKLPHEYVTASLAQALSMQGIKVFTDSNWQVFLVEFAGGSFGSTTGILRCQPFSADLDQQHFMGLSHATNSRRVSTIRSSEIATVEKDGNQSFALRMRDGQQSNDDFISLRLLGHQGENPWCKTPQGSVLTRVASLFSKK